MSDDDEEDEDDDEDDDGNAEDVEKMDGCDWDDEAVKPSPAELVDGVTVLADVATGVADDEESDDPESKSDNLSQKLDPLELLEVELVDAVDAVESEFPNKLLKKLENEDPLEDPDDESLELDESAEDD